MPAFPSGGAAVANPPLYPDYVSNAVFVVGGDSATLSPFSGPKGSPFDAKMGNPATPYSLTFIANTLDHSTGALNTGIGFDSSDAGSAMRTTNAATLNGVAGLSPQLYAAGVPTSVNNFSDNYIPGQTLPSGSAAADARLTAIGGGRSTITPGTGSDYSKGISSPNPYNNQPILDMGFGGSRDAGAGPAFTGFSMKLVTAAANVAQGAAIEAGFTNRTTPAASGISLLSGNNAFGSSTAASPAVA